MKDKKEIKYQNHLEVSESDTKLISSALCPLKTNEFLKNQLFENEDFLTPMCCIEGQLLQDNSFDNFLCPYFYGAIYPFKENLVDCRKNKYIQK